MEKILSISDIKFDPAGKTVTCNQEDCAYRDSGCDGATDGTLIRWDGHRWFVKVLNCKAPTDKLPQINNSETSLSKATCSTYKEADLK
jgi:hypothetical protein